MNPYRYVYPPQGIIQILEVVFHVIYLFVFPLYGVAYLFFGCLHRLHCRNFFSCFGKFWFVGWGLFDSVVVSFGSLFCQYFRFISSRFIISLVCSCPFFFVLHYVIGNFPPFVLSLDLAFFISPSSLISYPTFAFLLGFWGVTIWFCINLIIRFGYVFRFLLQIFYDYFM